MSRIGKVKSWSDEKGFGFILPQQENGNDIFVHRKVIGMQSSLVPGKEVRYDYALDKGKPQATSVSGEGVIKRSGFGRGADVQMGIIKSWLPEKGYGFIAQGPDGSGPDLFVLNTQANGALDKGMKVTYTLGVNPKTQKQWAENVTPYPMFDHSAFNQMAHYGAPYSDGFGYASWPQPNPYASIPFY
eukprot:TRINITY_DN748_c0_g1_i4.p1 TRINITY_DN748_c0_g1~~TRINITY_DN748_c0_g1_i4.p1  ORF type:complete len:187 (+),score=27.12 TRINITY_DN748_c0_g1_i4:18-578(+)